MKKFDVCLIACCKKKRKIPCRADELYTSLLFSKSLQFASQFGRPIYVLSARHHLIPISQIIAPYDSSLQSFSKDALIAWSKMVASQINSQLANKTILVLAGSKYLGFTEFCDNEIVDPLRRLGIGDRLAWLKANIKTERLNSQLLT
jgi:hypothetical protein